MVHEYCMETGIKDTSNNGVYHNRRFKEQAEAHGLTVEHHEKYGWTITSPSEELLGFIIFQGWQDIQMGERLAWSDMAGTGAGRAHSSTSWVITAGTAPYCSSQYRAIAISSAVSGHSFQPPKGR